MTEKKTFKNPYHISHSSDWIEVHQLENTEIPSFIGHEDEWDMEVTFTKKVKPLSVGQLVEVYHLTEIPFQAKVLWYDDTWCLFQQSKYHNPEVCKRDKL